VRPLRAALLYASTSSWLGERLPRHAFARRAVRRFMPGESLADALTAARRLQERGFPTVITQLGENVDDEGAVERVADHYEGAIDRIAEEGLDCHLSVKPTHLGLDVNSELCRASIERLAGAAAARGNGLWIDMEGSAWTSPTIALFRLLRARADNVGLCLQANLRRTTSDLAALRPLAPAIRLVKGAYAEPAERAFPRKRDVDAAYLALADELLLLAASPATTSRWGLPAIATHDVRIVRRIAAAAEARGLSRTSFEVQMLYGIRTREQDLLRREGFRVRVLISYGEHWFPWYMRRLAERPANLWFVIRSTTAG
jgi:proline dehydrogenase